MVEANKQTVNASLDEIQREPTLSEKVAQALTAFIFDNDMVPGDKLPSERELGERFKVSRTVIREAVRSLVGKGLVESQTGTRLNVSMVKSEAVSDLLGLVFRGHVSGDSNDTRRALWDLHEVRSTIETKIAGLAAQRATPEQIDQLEQVAKELGKATDDEACAQADENFHRAIAIASNNEFYVVILDSLVGPLRRMRRATLKLKSAAPDATAAHARILERISAHDVEGASAAMAVHIAESGRALRKLTRRNHDDSN